MLLRCSLARESSRATHEAMAHATGECAPSGGIVIAKTNAGATQSTLAYARSCSAPPSQASSSAVCSAILCHRSLTRQTRDDPTMKMPIPQPDDAVPVGSRGGSAPAPRLRAPSAVAQPTEGFP